MINLYFIQYLINLLYLIYFLFILHFNLIILFIHNLILIMILLLLNQMKKYQIIMNHYNHIFLIIIFNLYNIQVTYNLQ